MPVTVTPVQELIIDLAVRYGFQVLGAIAILTVGALLARWVGRLTDARLTRANMEPPMRLQIPAEKATCCFLHRKFGLRSAGQA